MRILASGLHVQMRYISGNIMMNFMRPILFMDPAPLEVQAEVRVPDLRPVADVVGLVQNSKLGALTLRPVVHTKIVHARRDPN